MMKAVFAIMIVCIHNKWWVLQSWSHILLIQSCNTCTYVASYIWNNLTAPIIISCIS